MLTCATGGQYCPTRTQQCDCVAFHCSGAVQHLEPIADDLESGAEHLVSGAEQLESSVKQLESVADQLESGVQRLESGEEQCRAFTRRRQSIGHDAHLSASHIDVAQEASEHSVQSPVSGVLLMVGRQDMTHPLREAVKRIFYPFAERAGFERIKGGGSTFTCFRRPSDNTVDLFDIQWDKYAQPYFVINFGHAPLVPKKIVTSLAASNGSIAAI